MHVTSMEPVERIRGDREAMYVYVRREHLERLRAEGRVPKRGKARGKGRARCADGDGEGTSSGNYPEPKPQYEPRVEMEE